MTGFAAVRGRSSSRWLGTLLAVVLQASAAPAMTLLPLDLPGLTTQAAHIFVGRVEAVATGRDGNGLPAVWTTFRVDQPLKGVEAGRITVKQLGAALGNADSPIVARRDVPAYRPGEELLLFVHPESALGFSSPVGLGQGCFRIHRHDGGPVAENDVGNRNLGDALAPAGARAATSTADRLPAGPVPLATLIARVRTLVASAP